MEEMNVLYEELEFVVVVKPSGLLSVPGRGPENLDCVSERVKALYPGCIEQPAVHRLDMDTSGLLVVARTKEVHRDISIQFQEGMVNKRYIAILDGELEDEEGRIELPFRLDIYNRPYQIYDPIHGKIGITHWKKILVKDGKTRIEFKPLTGRTHQLRVHAASKHGLGIPIVGDPLYGTGTGSGMLKLHACYLSFTHPRSGERLEFSSEPLF
jgi:tRNA pseudouridine32 synthase / 23S rRNA pseudouridine746 synthase